MIQRHQWKCHQNSRKFRYWGNLLTWVRALSEINGLTREQSKQAYDLGVMTALAISREENHRPKLLELQALFTDRNFGDWDRARVFAGVRGAIANQREA